MKFYHVVLVFILGSLITFLGALFKIQSWAGGETILTAGLLTTLLGGVLLVVKVFSLPEVKRLLRR